MTRREFEEKVRTLRISQPHINRITIDEKTAHEVFGKWQYKKQMTFGGFHVIVSKHLPDHSILPGV